MQRCVYCHKGSATVRCGNSECTKTFHFICGMRTNSLPQFINTFPMYCNAHHPAELMRPGNYGTVLDQSTCVVCTEALPATYSVTTTIESCCQRGWFHTACMRQFSLTAGYYMGCLMCRNTLNYREHIKQLGVFVPDREAHWEHKSNANIMALKLRHSRCDVNECLNPLGRDSRSLSASDRWTLWLCNICAAFGAHAQCVRESPDHLPLALHSAAKYMCPTCHNTVSRRPPDAERMPRSLADETLVEYDDDDLMNRAQYNSSADSDSEMEVDDDDVEVITISSDDNRTPSLRPSDSNSCSNRQSAVPSAAAAKDSGQPSPQTRSLENWLDYLEMVESSRARRIWRLRLLLGQEMSMSQRIRL